MTHRKSSRLLADFASLLCGALLPLAFAPIHLWPLAIISPAFLLLLWLKLPDKKSTQRPQFISPGRAFWRGFLYGLGWFGVGASWVFISIHTYGNTSPGIAATITFGFVAILSLFPALHGLLLTRYFANYRYSWLTFPALGVVLEWTRGWFLTGFPWLFFGVSQTHSPLAGFVPILGYYGMSFLVLLLSVLVLNFALKPRWAYLIPFTAVLVGGLYLNTLEWTHIKTKAIPVTLVQGNIAQEMRWDKQYIDRILRTYLRLTKNHLQQNLIFWPEGAVPVPLPDSEPFLDALTKILKKHDSTLVLGIPMQARQLQNYYNAIVAVGATHGTYRKQHLVPFGEYVPFERWLRGLIGFFDIPMSDFIAGPVKQTPITINGNQLSSYICYEIAYPHLVYDALEANSQYLVTLSNDAWFGHSWAASQHAEIAQYAALATGRPLILTSNTGITAIIDQHGKITAFVKPFTATALKGTINAVTGTTPWLYLGNAPEIIGLLLALGFVAWRIKRTTK